jgi:hypothetical protein
MRSPYASNFKSTICSADHDLLSQRLSVTKLARSELEDKYLKLCDENFAIKQANHVVREKMKKLMVQFIRNSNNSKKSLDEMSTGSVKSAAEER